MLKFLVYRIFESIPTLIGVTLLTFFIFTFAGGDPALRIAGRHATPERITELRNQLGTDLPLFMQYVRYVKKAVRMDFGNSWATSESTQGMILRGLGPSLSLTLPAFLWALFIAGALALVIATYEVRTLDRWTLAFSSLILSTSLLILILACQYIFAF